MYKTESGVLSLVDVQCANEASRFIDIEDFKLAIALHVLSCRKVIGFLTVRFGLFGGIASRARRTNDS